ncbi:glutamate-rich protein 3-like isoform X1, partial [Biomphalaria glabrata]
MLGVKVQQQSPKIENAKKVDKDQRKKEEGVKETVQEVETKDEVSSKPLSMKYSDTSDSSSEASDTEEKSKQTSKSSAPVAAPQIVEVKHEESDNEGKDSPVVVKKTSLTESTSSLSGSSDSSSSSSEDSDSEHSGSTKSPREVTPVKKLKEESETKKEKEQHVTEPVTFTFEHSTGEKKVETKDSQAPAFHSPPAHDTHLENESRLKHNEEAKPSTSITQSSTMPEVKMEDVRRERRSSTASTASASSSTISSSGSFSSSSSSSSEDSKSENQTSRSRADGNPPQEEPVIESAQAKNSFEFAEKIKIKETEDTSRMEEKIDVTVAIETVPQPETKGDDPVQRRNSDVSVSSLDSSSSSSVSSSSTEGSLVIKDEGGALVLEDEKVLLVQKDGGDVQVTEGNAGVKQSDQTIHRKAMENIDEIQESLSESGSKESQILDNSEKPKDDIELVNVPSIQRVVAPITMTDNEIKEIEETNESEDSSSSDSESDSSSSSESSGSQKGSRPGSSASNKSNEEKDKLKLALSPVITIQHADTYSSKPSESLEQTNPSPAPYEVPQPPTSSHVHDTKFDKEDELKQSEVDKTSQTLINDTNEDSVTSDSQTNAPVHFVRSHPPEPREGSILYELEKGHQIVDLKNIKLNKLQIQEAVEFLKAKQSMSQLSLVNCDLHDQDIQMLKDAVIASPSKPVVLNLSENLLTSACVPHILDLVKRKPSIEAVLLTGSNLGDNGVKQLVDGLLEQYKDSFQVDGEDVQSGEDGSKGLCELDLANCNIGDEGIEALGSLIRSGMAIDTLNLSLNTAVTQKGWVSFAQALSKAKVLETLALDNNDIGNEGLEEIARSLYDNSSLAALDLNNIHITDKGGKYLVELLKRNTFILEINLQENSLSNQL